MTESLPPPFSRGRGRSADRREAGREAGGQEEDRTGQRERDAGKKHPGNKTGERLRITRPVTAEERESPPPQYATGAKKLAEVRSGQDVRDAE